ncbi:BZ3500_MvSof-1268-A1-R1_C050g00189 [Microbotryum saponariae]|uniref:BZ3500_MvSof-1268-A1-R1_C050g00189 protein n=1 Tax=Microbotryum saponariae TaxID=289078 RepID=A0A2X0KUR8_9BASI|nr:BZ3500_MvSof-1268-A1-R1_C050g00189 [Microbotryum saponariae]
MRRLCPRQSVHSSPYGRLHPMPILLAHGKSAIDFMTGLPPVEFEGMMVAPNHADADSELVADRYYATIFRLHGTPSASFPIAIPSSTSQFWRALQAKTDGSSENRIKMVTNQTLRIMFALNSSVAVSTSLSAFEATYGYLPRRWPTDSWFVSDVPRAEAFARIRQLRNLDVTDAIIVPEGMKSKLLPALHWSFPYPSGHSSDSLPCSTASPYVENDAERFPGRDPAVLFVEDVADAADNSAIPERIVRDRPERSGNAFVLGSMIGRKDIDDTWMSEQSLRFDHPSLTRRYRHNSIAQIAAVLIR